MVIETPDGSDVKPQPEPDEPPPTFKPRVQAKPEILAPGAHLTPDYVEVGSNLFAVTLCALMPSNSIYRRADVLGQMIDGKFQPCDVDRLRLLIDQHVRIVHKRLDDKDKPESIYKPCSRDHAALFAAYARLSPSIDSLEHITPYPVFVSNPNAPNDWRVCRRGYSDGVFFHMPTDLFGMKPILDINEIRRLLLDLVVDFPFASEADRDTYFGCLLTPLLQPVINGLIPLHIATSPIPGSGKTKLMGEILGGIYFGHETPNLQFTGDTHEHGKIILGELLRGARLTQLDNLGEFIDSGTLAMLLTSRTFSGRLLGSNTVVECPNHMILVATGNNTRMTGELGRRTIPIRLEPKEQRPEQRSEFAHPNLAEYVAEQREQIMSALIGAVILWIRAGRPACPGTLGSFANWHRIVGGVMHHLGFTQWLANAQEWRTATDDFAADLEQLAIIWATALPTETTSSNLMETAKVNELFGWIFAKPDKAHATSFGMSVMRRAEGRVIEVPFDDGSRVAYRITATSNGSNKRYQLVRC